MNDIFATRLPDPGDTLILESLEFFGLDSRKTVVAEVTVTAVEMRSERVWNPVLRAEETVEIPYARLLYDGRPLLRRLVLGGIKPAAPRGFYREAPAASSAGEPPARPRD